MFVALTENFGNVRDKVKTFFALAPVVRLDNISDPFFTSMAEDIDSI